MNIFDIKDNSEVIPILIIELNTVKEVDNIFRLNYIIGRHKVLCWKQLQLCKHICYLNKII